MEDFRLYKPSGNYADWARTSEEMFRVVPEDPKASGIEVIAGKVVKFMLTEKGSDAFNLDYGSTSMHYLQMSQIFLPQFKREVQNDVERCLRFIQNADINDGVTGERLERIVLIRIDYKPQVTPWRIDVYLELITTEDNRAVVALNPNLKQD